MKKTTIITAAVLTAAIAIGGISAIAEGGFMKNKRFENKKPEITAEQKEQWKKDAKERLDADLAEGKITQEQYDKFLADSENGKPGFGFGFGRHMGKGRMPERKELTEEQKAEMKEKADKMKEEFKERLDSELAEGKITQEQYDKFLADSESGKPGFGFGFGRHMGKGRMPHNPGHRFNRNTTD